MTKLKTIFYCAIAVLSLSFLWVADHAEDEVFFVMHFFPKNSAKATRNETTTPEPSNTNVNMTLLAPNG